MRKPIDLTNQQFANLIAIRRIITADGEPRWECRCNCGKITLVRANNLKNGMTRSCGCIRGLQRKHGGCLDHRREYSSYRNMLNRCYNANTPYFRFYGGRGIGVCDRWRGNSGFPNFLQDMGKRPDKHSIDRKDNDMGYCPENCQWATKSTQNFNRRFLGRKSRK